MLSGFAGGRIDLEDALETKHCKLEHMTCKSNDAQESPWLILLRKFATELSLTRAPETY